MVDKNMIRNENMFHNAMGREEVIPRPPAPIKGYTEKWDKFQGLWIFVPDEEAFFCPPAPKKGCTQRWESTQEGGEKVGNWRMESVTKRLNVRRGLDMASTRVPTDRPVLQERSIKVIS